VVTARQARVLCHDRAVSEVMGKVTGAYEPLSPCKQARYEGEHMESGTATDLAKSGEYQAHRFF